MPDTGGQYRPELAPDLELLPMKTAGCISLGLLAHLHDQSFVRSQAHVLMHGLVLAVEMRREQHATRAIGKPKLSRLVGQIERNK